MHLSLITILTILSTGSEYFEFADALGNKGVVVFIAVVELYCFATGCPKNKDGLQWIYYHNQNTCHLTQKGLQLNYAAAEMWCRKYGGYLTMPKFSNDEDNMVKHADSSTGLYFIGLDNIEDRARLVWADGTILRKWQKPWKWVSGSREALRCVQYDVQKKEYQLVMCEVKRPFVCEASDYDEEGPYKQHQRRCPRNSFFFDCGGFCYWYDTKKYSFQDAIHKCKGKGNLAMPKTKRQWRALYLLSTVASNENNQYGVWIGVFKDTSFGREWNANGDHIGDKNWTWLDGSYSKDWFVANMIGNRDGPCAVMSMKSGSTDRAFGVTCEGKYPVICQKRQNLTQSKCGEMTKAPDLARRKKRESQMENQEKLPIFFGSSEIESKPDFSNISLGRLSDHGTGMMTIEEFPWYAKVYFRDILNRWEERILCGAVIIGPRWILTAAHCLTFWSNGEPLRWLPHPHNIKVGYGSEDKGLEHERYQNEVINFWVPTGYTSAGNSYIRFSKDIAILELAWPIPLNCPNVRPICYDPPKDTKYSEHLFILGFEDDSELLKYCYIRDRWNYDYYKTKTGWIMHPYDHENSCHMSGNPDDGGPVAALQGGGGPPPYEWRLLGILTTIGTTPDTGNRVANHFTLIKPYYKWINQIIGTAKYGLYTSVSDIVAWEDAATSCKDKGGSLAMPKTWRQLKEMEDVFRKLEERSLHPDYKTFWIGALGNRRAAPDLRNADWPWMFNWVDKTPFDAVALSAWQPGEPNNLNEKEDCVAMNLSEAPTESKMKTVASGMKDLPCSTKLPYFCEFPPYQPALDAIPDYKPPDPADTVYTHRACDTDVVDFSCTYGWGPVKTYVKVVHAMLGRQSVLICLRAHQKMGCHSDVTNWLSKTCNGKNRCRLHVSALPLFIENDPCKGYSRYVEMTYKCEEKENYYQAVCANEHGQEKAHLTCQKGFLVKIVKTTWGRGNPYTCSASMDTEECTEQDPELNLSILNYCVEKLNENCTFNPANFPWPKDPCPGKYKYFEFYWTCEPTSKYTDGDLLASGDGKIKPQVFLTTIFVVIYRLIHNIF